MLASTARVHLRDLTRAAARFGVTFPEPVADLFAFDPALPNLGEVEADVVAEIASAFGTKTYAKTRDAALDRLARAEAASRISSPLDEALVRGRWSSIALHAEEIVEAFRAALAEDVEGLNRYAALVPATATEDSTLDPEAYAARFHATTHAERLAVVTAALAPLYGVSNGGAGIESGIVRQRMTLVRLPEDLDRSAGQAIARGLTGVRLVSMSGDATSTAALWWAVVAAHGATFDLVSREEYASNVAAMRDAVRVPALGDTLPATLVLS